MRISIFIVILSFLKITSCHQTKGEQTKDYTDCSKYGYFEDKLPTITRGDSLALVEYAKRNTSHLEYAFNNNDTNYAILMHLLPVVWNRVDTGWMRFLYSEAGKAYSFKQLLRSDIYTSIMSDAIILGTVSDKTGESDSSKCVFFKTSYEIIVEDVIHSYFPLKKGDKILIKDVMGFVGGCSKKYDPNLKLTVSHLKEYQKGESSLFILDKTRYEMFFIKKGINIIEAYQDNYCSQAFRMSNGNGNFNEDVKDKLIDLKLFFQTEFVERNYPKL